eukprot:6193459-Pleurochrysis_carterae.AAC.1
MPENLEGSVCGNGGLRDVRSFIFSFGEVLKGVRGVLHKLLEKFVKISVPPGSAYVLTGSAQGRTKWCAPSSPSLSHPY